MPAAAICARVAVLLAIIQGCVDVDVDALPTSARPETLVPANERLAIAREDEKLADDVEAALSERWSGVADVLRESALPIAKLERVLQERGLPDSEAGFSVGVFGAEATRRRYFAAVLLGWSSEAAALKVAARVEARRLSSLEAARAELPDVDQRSAVEHLARVSSDRLHGLCRLLSTRGDSCMHGLLERNVSEREVPAGPRS